MKPKAAFELIMVLAAVLAAFSCNAGVQRIQTYSLPGSNPTSYSFPLPVTEVHQRAWQAFSMEHQDTHPIFRKSSSMALETNLLFESTLFAECATNAVFAEKIFHDPANSNDIYLHSFGSPFVISPVYHGKKGGFPFIASFHVHLAASGTNTIATVIASDTQVINGTKFGFGPCGPGMANNYVDVKPTTIEEYTILRYLGDYLGVTNMPPVVLPKP